MSEPRRIRDSEQDPLLRAALEASNDDDAPDGAEVRMLAALGLVTAAKAATVATASAATAAKTAGAAGAATTSKIAVFAGVTKWVIAGSVVAAVATGGAVAYRVADTSSVPRATPDVPVAPVPSSLRAVPPPPPVELPPVVENPPEEPIEPPPRVEPAPSARVARTVADAGAPATVASTPTDEIAVLGAAADAVHRRDADAATRALDAYDARFPKGALAIEAESLRIETIALRDPARGRALATSFLQRHPSSPLTRRMRKIAETTP